MNSLFTPPEICYKRKYTRVRGGPGTPERLLSWSQARQPSAGLQLRPSWPRGPSHRPSQLATARRARTSQKGARDLHHTYAHKRVASRPARVPCGATHPHTSPTVRASRAELCALAAAPPADPLADGERPQRRLRGASRRPVSRAASRVSAAATRAASTTAATTAELVKRADSSDAEISMGSFSIIG